MTLPIILIHGYLYNPSATNKDNPHATLFKKWREQLEGFSVINYGWFSVPPTFNNLFKAWSKGYYTRYRWAWNLAKHEADSLIHTINNLGECNIIAHSLGTRVALQAIKKKANIRTAIFLSGAEYSSTASIIAENSSTQFHNMWTHEDDVLSKLGRGAPPLFGDNKFIGQTGLGIKLDNWKDYQLDSEELHAWGRENGYDLRGDNPDSIGDHRYSHTWLPNWELYRDILTKRGAF